MPESPEARARKNIDQLLTDAGWVVQSREDVNLAAGRGIAIREFPMKTGFGEADYLLYLDGQALGVVEAKKEGSTLTGFEGQTAKYSEGLPDSLPAPKRPLPFGYQSTGIETRFTNLLEPDAASRNVFSFHRPETVLVVSACVWKGIVGLKRWVNYSYLKATIGSIFVALRAGT